MKRGAGNCESQDQGSFSLERYLQATADRPKPRSFAEIREQCFDFLLTIYQESLNLDEFSRIYAQFKITEELDRGRALGTAEPEEVVAFVSKRMTVIKNFGEGLGINAVIKLINQQEARGTCGVLAPILTTYLNKIGIHAKALHLPPDAKGVRHWIVRISEYSQKVDIDPVEIIEPYLQGKRTTLRSELTRISLVSEPFF